MTSVVDHFDRLGLGGQVELERFGPPPVDPALDAGDGVVVFARTGDAAPADGTLLDHGRGRRAQPALRMPQRHLRHVHDHQVGRRRPQPRHRSGVCRRRRARAALRLGALRRGRRRPVATPALPIRPRPTIEEPAPCRAP